MDFFRAILQSVGDDIENGLPECRERSLALTHLEEAMFWTIGTIARNQDKIIEAKQ